tara:strand:+ start:340 stop:528 length:189 start_codon:yes stop_codon:yes gene_type:complete
MADYINARVDLELDGDEIMSAITDDICDIARSVMNDELDIEDQIQDAIARELENYEIVFVRK